MKAKTGLFFILLITFFIYFPSLFYHFTSDDYYALTEIITSSSLSEAFSFRWPAPLGGYFRPVAWLPYFLGKSLTGLPVPPDPQWLTNTFLLPYHILSLVFHLSNIFLVYLIASFIFKDNLWRIATVLIFATHPANVEAVCWVATFADLSFSFFLLLSIILFAKFCLGQGQKPPYLYFLGSFLSFILALLSKELALCLPFLILLTGLFLRKAGKISVGKISAENKRWRFWIWYFLPIGPYFALRHLVLPLADLPWRDFLKNSPGYLSKLVYFMRDLICPVDLTLVREFLYNRSWVSPVIVIAFFSGLCFFWWFIRKVKQYPAVFFSLIWIGITLGLPLLIPFAVSRRQLYLPLVGYSILLIGFLSIFRKRLIAALIISLLVFLQVVETLQRSALFGYTAEVVQRGLSDLKENLPRVEANSQIYLLGIPGVAQYTPAFWVAPEEKIRFIYQDKDLAVTCLSLVNFTKENIVESEFKFLDGFTFIQSMPTDLEAFIRVPTEEAGVEDGRWKKTVDPKAEFKILKRDRFGHIEKIMFRLNAQGLKGKRVYLIGFKDGRVRVLKNFLVS